eukprot:155934_1
MVFLIIYTILIIQLIYFLITSMCYVYHNPQYRVFWAACCMKKPKNIKANPMICPTGKHATSGSTTFTATLVSPSFTSSTAQSNHSNEFVFNLQYIRTKKTAFIHYGLGTISHCVLMNLYLICLIFLLCVRFSIAYLTETSQWKQKEQFCSYAYKLLAIIPISHYALQIYLCLPSLRIQYMYKTNKCERLLPIISVVFMIISTPMGMLRGMIDTKHVALHNGDMLCVAKQRVFDSYPTLAVFVSFSYYFSFILCFITIIVPLYRQRKMLLNLPKTKQNEALVALIAKINELSKRMCIAAMVIIVLCVTENALYWFFAHASNPRVKPFLSICQWSIYVYGYLLIVFIHKDWKRRLCSLCAYGYLHLCGIKLADDLAIANSNQISCELVTTATCTQTPVSIPRLVKDVSKCRPEDTPSKL